MDHRQTFSKLGSSELLDINYVLHARARTHTPTHTRVFHGHKNRGTSRLHLHQLSLT